MTLANEHMNQPGRIERRKLWMLVCAAGAPFLIMLDTNIVAVSLPAIARDLHGSFRDVEWVVTAYLLPFTALLMPAGALADRHGRRRMMLVGLAIFTLASLLCGLAPTLAVLNMSLALQAVGAALQLTASLAVIGHGFSTEERTRVFAIWGTVMGAAPSLGPVVGGIATSWFGWRWAFLVNVPLGIVLIWVGASSIDESKDPGADRLDLPGIALFGSGLGSVVWALIDGNAAGWTTGGTLIKLAIGAALLGAFVFAERARLRPMMDLSLFRRRAMTGAAVATLGYAAAAQLMMTFLPLYLQDAFDYSPLRAGLAMIPFALPLFFGPTVGRGLAARLSSRDILAVGLALVAVGNALTSSAMIGRMGYSVAAVGMFITGCGAGLLNSETVKVQVGAAPQDRAGMASGMATTTRFIALVVGLAGIGALLLHTAERTLRQVGEASSSVGHIDFHSMSSRIVAGDARGAVEALPNGLREGMEHAVGESIASGFAAALAAAACIAALAALVSWRLLSSSEPAKRPANKIGV